MVFLKASDRADYDKNMINMSTKYNTDREIVRISKDPSVAESSSCIIEHEGFTHLTFIS